MNGSIVRLCRKTAHARCAASTHIQYLIEDNGEPAQKDDRPHVLESVGLEAESHPDRHSDADNQAHKQEVETDEIEGIACGIQSRSVTGLLAFVACLLALTSC